MAFCEYCGKRAEEGDNNCTACGAKLSVMAQQPQQQSQAWQQPPPQWQAPPPWQQVPPTNQSAKTKAGVGLGLGLFALFMPIPFLDVIAGIVGICLSASARKEGAGGLATGGLVVSILGLISAIIFTLNFLI